jgi:hypothetical protein
MNDGFVEFFEEYDPDFAYRSSAEFRQRHLVGGLARQLAKVMGG